MRVEILKPPPSGLIPTGWIVAIVGGTVMVFTLIFVLFAYPMSEPYDYDFPRSADGTLDRGPRNLPMLYISSGGEILLDGKTLDLTAVPAALDRLERIETGMRFNVERGTTWMTAREAIRAARAAGAPRIEFTVRKDAGLFGVIVLESTEPLPDLPADATTQAFIDALSERR